MVAPHIHQNHHTRCIVASSESLFGVYLSGGLEADESETMSPVIIQEIVSCPQGLPLQQEKEALQVEEDCGTGKRMSMDVPQTGNDRRSFPATDSFFKRGRRPTSHHNGRIRRTRRRLVSERRLSERACRCATPISNTT